MLLVGLFLAILFSPARALPVSCELRSWAVEKLKGVVCEANISQWPCPRRSDLENPTGNELKRILPSYVYSNHKRQEPTESGSDGPALGTILGGVFGAVGGLAVIGAIFYAWWSIRRVKRNHAAHDRNASSSFGGGVTHSQLVGQQASKDSRGSSSNKSRQSRKKPAGTKWQDPWLATPKPPRTVPVAVKLDRPGHAMAAGSGKAAGDDRTSESSGVPLDVIVSNVDDERKAVHHGL
ncbi:P12 domain-containing protein [Ceratobasidium sp. AG-Ba]|nr:P12 domain-containing protein [Ceratobasidium sp. AG-Ba]